ncbi:DUF1611 domain-containing protein [Flagellimonas sp.]|uniref:DUF1611 domain-containing protein n=1 Tax=Flagellimonas sp. TaxID=2058762 RepID=UPI003BB10837
MELRSELCLGQQAIGDKAVDLGIPKLTLVEALNAGIRSLWIGVAPVGGILAKNWLDPIMEAASLRVDIMVSQICQYKNIRWPSVHKERY